MRRTEIHITGFVDINGVEYLFNACKKPALNETNTRLYLKKEYYFSKSSEYKPITATAETFKEFMKFAKFISVSVSDDKGYRNVYQKRISF